MSAPDPVTPVEPTGGHTASHRDDLVGVLMYLGAAFLFAVNGSVSKTVLEAGLAPPQLTELRNAGALVVMLAVVALARPEGLRVRRAEVPLLVAYGVVAFAVVQWLYFVTISLLPVGIGTLLAFLAPVVVALWVRFGRRQPVKQGIWAALALTLAGLLLVAQVGGGGGGLDPVGVVAGLALAVTLSLYWLLGEAGQRTRDPLSLTLWGFVFATLAWSVAAPWWHFPWDVLAATADPPAGGIGAVPVWLLAVWVVLLGTVAPFLLVVGSLRRIGAQRAGIVGTTEPVFATVVAYLVLGETLSTWQVVGGLVVLAGVVVAERSR